MSDTIQVYVGTDQRSKPAERVLEHSIYKHVSQRVSIHWMRQGDNGFTGWRHQPDIPHPPEGWATGFTCFRYAVPELAGFEGRAIYLDSDMVVFGDLAELWSWPTNKPWFCASQKRTDVSVIDCAAFKGKDWWPSIQHMREHGIMGHKARTLLQAHGFLEEGLPEAWNHLDSYVPGFTKLLHFTRMQTQPWEPWPERFNYRDEIALRHKKEPEYRAAVDVFLDLMVEEMLKETQPKEG